MENRIFARAAVSGAHVEACRGELSSASADVSLHVMICVYNAFFAEENRLFLADQLEEDWAAQHGVFLRRVGGWGLKRPRGMPFFKRDEAGDLFWLRSANRMRIS